MATPFGIRPSATPSLGWAKRRNCIAFGTKFTITAAGAILAGSQDSSEFTGMSQVVKTAAQVGRYTFGLPVTYKNIREAVVTIIGPDSANYGANTTGLQYFFRRDDITANTKDGTIELQFVQTSYADAEVPSGVTLIVKFEVETGV